MRVAPDGKPLTLRVFARSEASDSQTEASYIQEWLKAVGIKADIQVMSEDALTDIIGKGQYDMFLWDWSFGADPESTLSVFVCDARSTKDDCRARFRPAGRTASTATLTTRQLYKQEATLVDPAQRAPVVKQALKHLYDNAMYSTLYYANTLQAYRKDRFTGFVAQPGSGGRSPASSVPGPTGRSRRTWRRPNQPAPRRARRSCGSSSARSWSCCWPVVASC